MAEGRVESVNVGTARSLAVRDGVVDSGIFKTPQLGPQQIDAQGVVGDVRVAPRKFGGENHAIHVYPAEHYATWWAELGGVLQHLTAPGPFGPGGFGENLTVRGAREHEVHLGDVVRCGTVEMVIVQPRIPCRRLTARVGIEGFSRMFLESMRVGYYLRVISPGTVERGDEFAIIDREPAAPTIEDFIRASQLEYWDIATLRRLLAARGLPEMWREPLSAKIARAEKAEAAGGWAGPRIFRVRSCEPTPDARVVLSLECPRGRPLPPIALDRSVSIVVRTLQGGPRISGRTARATADRLDVITDRWFDLREPESPVQTGELVRCLVVLGHEPPRARRELDAPG